ncbi:MAG: hypothetical protein JWO38_2905 [Gemmataceae bacterium]|nr:hypothetical protein [Gemmataceae bacterium]
MAKGRGSRGPTRMDLRRQAEAAEARGGEEEETEVVEEEGEADEEPDAEAGEGDEEGGAKKKKPAKKKAAPKVKKPATKRVRAQKEVRQRAVWVVFDNASKRVDTFPFNQKAEAEALLAKKVQEKEGKATFYLNLVKEEIT